LVGEIRQASEELENPWFSEYMKQIFEVQAEVLEQEKVGQDCYRLSFKAPQIAGLGKPGQFVNIACNRQYDVLLRRPLTIYRVYTETGVVAVVYRVRGRGTSLLSRKRPGENIDVLGPLGHGFEVDFSASRAILVSGGVGVASMMFLAEKLVALPKDKDQQPYIYALIGAHSSDDIICVGDFAGLGNAVRVNTWVTRVMLEKVLSQLLEDLSLSGVETGACSLYTCGPKGMLKKIAQWAKDQGMFCQVSLEEHMACGVGACQSCVCKVKANQHDSLDYRYASVCREGPVFKAEEVKWDE
jgi:dihydroorotate dehydrogenase electron transfer subunit